MWRRWRRCGEHPASAGSRTIAEPEPVSDPEPHAQSVTIAEPEPFAQSITFA